jgi:hypothetical protein
MTTRPIKLAVIYLLAGGGVPFAANVLINLRERAAAADVAALAHHQ